MKKYLYNIGLLGIVMGALAINNIQYIVANTGIGDVGNCCDINNHTCKCIIDDGTHTDDIEEIVVDDINDIVIEDVVSIEEIVVDSMIIDGDESIEDFDKTSIVFHELPQGIDYSTFQPYMDYRKITSRTSPQWQIVHSDNSYVDSDGFLRYMSTDGITVDGDDDYVIALGNAYKDKGVVGGRYLIVTTTGAYTAIVGDEKDDRHTNKLNQYSMHGDKAGLIEWLVDTDKISPLIKKTGTVTSIGDGPISGEIIYLCEIQ